MKKYKLLILSILFIGNIFAQKTPMCSIDVKVSDRLTEKKEAGAVVAVFDGTVQIATQIANNKGGVVLEVPTGKNYKVVISKAGKVTRFFYVDLKNVNAETLPPGDKVGFATNVSLFEDNPNIDFAYVRDNPFTIFTYDGSNPNLVADDKIGSKMSTKIDKLLKDAEKNKGDKEAEYNAFIKEAQTAESAKDLAKALDRYEMAVLKKPGDKLATEKIAELDALLKAQKANNIMEGAAMDDYNALVKAGDVLVNTKKYEEALAKYEEAKLLRPKEQGIKDKIDDTQTKWLAAKAATEKDKKYTDAITAGDALFKQKSWKAAKDQYIIAGKAKPDEQLPKTQIAAIDAALNKDADAAANKIKIDAALKIANDLFAQGSWAEAKAKYNEVLVLDPLSAVSKAKIIECDSKLKGALDAEAKKVQIAKLLADGEIALGKNEFTPAKLKFDEVLKLEPTNATALAQNEIIKSKLANETKFQGLVKEGDALAKTAKPVEALAKYEAAKSIRTDKALEDKITALKLSLDASAAKKENAAKFDAAIKAGDALQASGNLEDAKLKFSEAITYDAVSKIPTDKIKAIDKIITDKANNLANIEKAKAEVEAANVLRDQKKFGEAKLKYQSAQKLDPSNTNIAAEIAKIDQQIALDAAEVTKKKTIETALKSGDDLLVASKLAEAKVKFVEVQKLDPSNADAAKGLADIATKEVNLAASAANKIKYTAALKEGEDLVKLSKFEEAKAKFELAKTFDATQVLPQQRIDAINKTISDQAGLAQKNAEYKAIVDAADVALASNDLVKAKSKYSEASLLKPTEVYPKSQLALIAKKESDALLLENNKKLYAELMASADGLEKSSKWNEALAKYQQAQKLDPTQSLPKERIEFVNKKLTDLAANDSKAKAYQAAIQIADNLFNTNKFTEARVKYEAAKGLDITQTYPQERISAIDAKLVELQQGVAKAQQISTLLADGEVLLKASNLDGAEAKFNQVLVLEPTNTTAVAKLAQIKLAKDAQLSALGTTAKWNKLQADAQIDANAQKLDEAKAKLAEAKAIKTTPELEKSIKVIDDAIATRNAALGQQALYTKTMTDASKFENDNKLPAALAAYQKAALMSQDDDSAKNKVKEIQEKIENASADAKTEQLYKTAISSADAAFNSKNYLEAIKLYNVAGAIKPNEKYPVDQAAKAAELSKSGSNDADIKYNSIIKAAQKKLDDKDYAKALELYQRASTDRPTDVLPKEKIELIKGILNSQEADKALEAKKLADYNAFMTTAEGYVVSKEYGAAIANFEKAKALIPIEIQPQIRIDAVKLLMNSQLDAAAKEANYKRLITEADAAFNTTAYPLAITKYTDALSIKQDAYPKAQIELAQLKIAAKQKEDAYKRSMADGLINVTSKSYETAIDNFNTALIAKPNDATAIRELENAKKLLAASKKPVANPLFAKYVAEADALFAGEKWLEAEKVYVKALAIDQTSSYVDKQIVACKEQLNIQGGIEEEKAYQKIITTANKYAAEEKYDEAIGLLERAKKNRTVDPYPPIRIAEIRALKEKKNPTITSVPTKQIIKQEGVQEVNLTNLGTQDAIDVKAAQAELNKGASKKKYLRDKRVKNLEEKNKGFITSLDSTTTVKNNVTSESIEQRNKQELINAQDLNEDIRDNSEKIILEEKKTTAYNIQSATYENTDVLNATKSVEALEIETNNNLYKGNELKDVNNEEIKTRTLIEQGIAFENDQNYIADGRNSEEILQAILLDNSKVDYDNGQLRKETAQQVEDLQKDVRSNETAAYTNEITSVQSAQEITDGYQKDGQTIFTDAEIKKMEMIDLMQAQEKTSAAYNISADEKDNDINKVVEHELTERQLLDSKAFIDSDNGRLNNVESFKGVDEQYYEYNRIENEKEGADLNKADKSLADLENEKLNGFTTEDKSIKASVAGVETEQQNQTNTYVVADQSKTANHYTNTESLDEVAKENAAISPANDKKLQENTDAITKDAKEADKVRTDAVLAKELEMQNTKIMLAKLESKEIRYDEKMANTLAQQFPEGVSQENFPRYDQEGIMVGQVTRRIVVIGNRGDVYLRYQSLAGITYQKNGQAITEYIWQSESQNGKLKRNY